MRASPGVRVPGVRIAVGTLLREPDFDVVLAVAAFTALLIDPVADHRAQELTPLAAALAGVTAPLVVRRRHPLTVLAAVVPLLLACLAVFHPDRTAVAMVTLAVFTVGRHRGRSGWPCTPGRLTEGPVTHGKRHAAVQPTHSGISPTTRARLPRPPIGGGRVTVALGR